MPSLQELGDNTGYHMLNVKGLAFVQGELKSSNPPKNPKPSQRNAYMAATIKHTAAERIINNHRRGQRVYVGREVDYGKGGETVFLYFLAANRENFLDKVRIKVNRLYRK